MPLLFYSLLFSSSFLLFSVPLFAHGLLAGTLIRVPSGQIPIENLQIGDEVMACDENSCQPGAVTQKSLTLVSGYIEANINGEIFHLSEDHPIWDEKTHLWVNASTYALRYIDQVTWLYNIAIDEHHNYHIGNNTLVHNFITNDVAILSAFSDRDQAMLLICLEAEKIGLHNPSQLAYIMATAEHETNNFKSMKEIGGQNARYAPYYGRGYVQLTHDYNYKKFGKLLNVDLLNNPDLVLDKKKSAFIIVYGMLHGEFTGAKLVTYINDLGNGKGKVDFMNARRVVNGVKHADRVAALAIQWMQFFREHKHEPNFAWLFWSAYHDEF